MQRSELRSRGRTSCSFSIMMNCVLTQASTVTRSCSIMSSVAPTSNRSATMVGLPRIAGVKWAVHSPNPNGAGMAERNTSSEVSSAASTASWWK
jgi:hypothetical protein